MTKQQFIDAVAANVQKYAPQYDIRVCSPIIAQAILESGWGESKLASQYHNYFGLKTGTKWTGKAVNLKTQEEYTVGTRTTITDAFRMFDSLEEGVKGYFEFIQLARYQNLRGITDPQKYLETIKADGYATSSTYVENNMKLIRQYELTKYDTEDNMSKTESAILWMENKAKDDSHGYDQIYRWGEKGDYDCSAAVISAWQQAGAPVKTNGATYTGNMLSIFKKCGFADITSQVNLATGSGLTRGDVLLNTGHHTAMYCGNGQEVEASINEKGKATGGTPGDQTGKEFLIRSYRNYPWNHVLRYQEGSSAGSGSSFTVLRKGSTGSSVKTMQQMLITCGYSCGASGVDGDFGSATEAAVIAFQKAAGIIADGEYGSQTKSKLTTAYNKKTASTGTDLNRTPRWVGKVTADALNVRSWAGTENPRIKSWPLLYKGNQIDVCDTVKAKDGKDWYYIRIDGRIYGFVSAAFIAKA